MRAPDQETGGQVGGDRLGSRSERHREQPAEGVGPCVTQPGGAVVREVTLVGGGLAGALLALMLARKGVQVTVYERRADVRVDQIEEGRSINLALSVRGIHALNLVGVAGEVLTHAIARRRRYIHTPRGNTSPLRHG